MRFMTLMCIIVLSIGWSGITYAEQVKKSPEYNSLMETLDGMKADDTMKIVIGTQKKSYKLGESFEARFQAEQACYLTLMHISSANVITFFAPSRYFQKTQIEEKRVYSTDADLGLKIKTGEPTGSEILNIFCTREPFDFFKADFEKTDVYQILPDDTTHLKELQSQIEQLNQMEWTGSSVTFNIGVAKNGTREFSKRGILKPIDATGSTGRALWPIDATGSTGHTDDEKPTSNE